MAVQTVACPGCKATLKAPEQMFGKKAKCKKCGTSFRIPGGPEGDTVGDGQLLSAMDLPVPAAPPSSNPFAFDATAPTDKPAPKPPEQKQPRAVPKPASTKAKAAEEEIPAAEVVEDEEPPVVAPAVGGDPFAFGDAPSSGKSKLKDEPKPKSKALPNPGQASEEPDNAFAFDGGSPSSEQNDESETDEPVVDKSETKSGIRRAYKSKSKTETTGEKSGGGGRKLIIAAVVFGVIVAGGVGGAIIYAGKSKAPELVKNDEKKPPEPPPTPPTELPKEQPKVNPKEKEKGTTPQKADPNNKKNTASSAGPMLRLPPGRTISFLPMNPKPESIGDPSNRISVVPTLPADVADSFGAARKVFPPLKKDIDLGVLWETAKGLQGAGQKLLLGIYSPLTQKQVNQVAFDGDGLADPACDLSADANLFVHGHTGTNVINVWDTRTNAKVMDGFNPYTDPKNKDLKLAAVYLTEPPKVLVTVSTTGAVHAFNVQSKEQMAGEFAPPKPPTKPLVAGKHIAPGPNHLSVIIFSGGSFYQVGIGPTVDGKEIVRLDGDVGQSLGIAASGSGKMLFAFETDDKKDRAVMEVRGDGKHVFYRWPDKEAGVPNGVAWVDDGLAMVASDKGACVWFEAEGNEFKPVGLARTPNEKGRHVASDGHWTLLPDPTNPKQCVLVEYSKPQSGLVGALDSSKQPPSALLTDKGLFK